MFMFKDNIRMLGCDGDAQANKLGNSSRNGSSRQKSQFNIGGEKIKRRIIGSINRISKIIGQNKQKQTTTKCN